MATIGPSTKTIKTLYALSGNRCGFPGCPNLLINGGSNMGEIAHIKAENDRGPRWDFSQTDDARRSFANLMLLCGYHHHMVDDNFVFFTVEVLTKMKADHEATATAITDEAEIGLAAGILIAGNVTVNAPNAQNSTVAGVIVNHHYGEPSSTNESSTVYQGIEPKDGPARFRAHGSALGKLKTTMPFADDPNTDVLLVDGPCFWLRLLPLKALEKQWTFHDLEIAAGATYYPRLRTFFGPGDYKLASNDGIGRFVTISGDKAKADDVTFLFRSGEIWNISRLFLREFANKKYFALSEVRKHLPSVIGEYAAALVALGIPPPFRFILGIEGCEGYSLAFDRKSNANYAFSPKYVLMTNQVVMPEPGLYSPGDDASLIADDFSKLLFAECGDEMPLDIL